MKHTYIKPLAVVLLLGVSTLTLSSAFAHKGKKSESATVTPSATTTNVIVTPAYGIDNTVGVLRDSPLGIRGGSIASNGLAKTEMYFTPENLFGHAVTLAQVANMSYWTKTGATHIVDTRDWFLAIYTKPYTGDVSTANWYGDRIGSEPYFSFPVNDPANVWNQWTTSGTPNQTPNQLRFFESTAGAPGANFGTYTDPDWAKFVSGNALSGLPYATHEILYFSIQTASDWVAGFTGKLDGLRIELKDGSVANINFEAINRVVTNKETEEEAEELK